jgi:hypothetical protein
MNSPENDTSNLPENKTPENSPENPPANPAPAINAEPINPVAVEIQPEQLLSPAPAPSENATEKKKRGRPPGSKTKKPENPPQIISQIPGEPGTAPAPEGTEALPGAENGLEASPEAPEAVPVDYRAQATMAVALTTGILSKVIGPEWEPENEKEMESVVIPLEAYFRTKQMPDLPPGWIVAIAIAGYSAKRLSAPATQSFVSRTKDRAKMVFLWLKNRLSKKKKFTPQIVSGGAGAN